MRVDAEHSPSKGKPSGFGLITFVVLAASIYFGAKYFVIFGRKVTSSSTQGSHSTSNKEAGGNVALQHLPADQRLSSGSVLVDHLQILRGKGTLTLDNGLSEDACVKLVSNGSLEASFYVRGGEKFTFDHIFDGTYRVLYCIGYGWNPSSRDFARGRQARQFDSPLVYSSGTHPYSVAGLTTYRDEMTLTLHKVPSGNAPTSNISLQEFDRY